MPIKQDVIGLLVLGVPILAASSSAQNSPSISEQLAKTYGLDSFGQIEQFRYTFNAEGALSVSRTWVWEPKADRSPTKEKTKRASR